MSVQGTGPRSGRRVSITGRMIVALAVAVAALCLGSVTASAQDEPAAVPLTPHGSFFSRFETRRNYSPGALTDSDFDIRDTAAEALFSLTESSFDYDPAGPPDERMRVVEQFLGTPPADAG